MKTISIDRLLTWAFSEELPKVGSPERVAPSAAPSSWSVLSDVIALGTMIDKSPNRFGVISSFVYQGEPHPDAMAVGRAVKRLADRDGYEIADGWNPFPEWPDEHGLIRTEVARVIDEMRYQRSDRINGKHVVNLVITSAILKRGPIWEAEPPKVVTVKNHGKDAWFVMRRSKNGLGKVVEYEDNGFDQRKQRAMRGAYRKYRLAEPIRSAIVARLEWQLWQSALEALVQDLAGALTSFEIAAFVPVRHPWLTQRFVATAS